MGKVVGNRDFLPVLLGGDINVYSMARAFHEAYGFASAGFGMTKSGVCMNSAIIDYQAVANADDPAVLFGLVGDLAKQNSERIILPIPVGDSYIQALAAVRDRLPENVRDSGITSERFEELTDKSRFYDLCAEYGLDYPDSQSIDTAEALEDIHFEYPLIIKPADGVAYWSHPFPDMEKVYLVRDAARARAVCEDIFNSGYDKSLIVQEYIPGDDTYMRVLTTYSNHDGKVLMSCMGHVLLEEHTPKGKGNHAVIISRQDLEVELAIKAFLESIAYTGPANFDFKYDERTQSLKLFEINLRQGRSNYYVTASGLNLAELIADDLVYHQTKDYVSVNKPTLWMVIPPAVAIDNIDFNRYFGQMHKLIASDRSVNPLIYKADKGLRHQIRVKRSMLRHASNFRRFYKREQM